MPQQWHIKKGGGDEQNGIYALIFHQGTLDPKAPAGLMKPHAFFAAGSVLSFCVVSTYTVVSDWINFGLKSGFYHAIYKRRVSENV